MTINIEFDEKSVFTFDKENLSIGVWDHRDGRYEGPIEGPIASIKFADKVQMGQFQEMIELCLEKEPEL